MYAVPQGCTLWHLNYSCAILMFHFLYCIASLRVVNARRDAVALAVWRVAAAPSLAASRASRFKVWAHLAINANTATVEA